MQRYPRFSFAMVLVALFAIGCTDSKTSPPTDPIAPGDALRSAVPGTCTTLAHLKVLTNAVFGSGSPNAIAVLAKLDSLDMQLKNGRVADAQSQARQIVAFVQSASAAGQVILSRAQLQALITGVFCVGGVHANTFVILPSDHHQVITESTGQGGMSLPAHSVAVPTLITLELLDPLATSPLITKLDKYPGYLEITSSSILNQPAVVAVCPSASVPADVVGRLRLGHQASTGFEITPAADGGFLSCSGIAASRTPRWLRQLAQVFLPTPLYAATTFAGGGVGGLASEFSPFGPVDPQLGITAGHDPACPSVEAPTGTQLSTACRPVVTVATRNGTLMQNVPVGWAVTSGGGAIAANVLLSGACGTFAPTAATTTDASGKAGVCWTLGPALGTNTVGATPSAGGDAPVDVNFAPTSIVFTATGTHEIHAPPP